MQWANSNGNNPHRWVSRSTDGYYAIAYRISDDDFEAFHIEALWATPTAIGVDRSLASAQQICETHRTASPSPA